MRDNLKTFDYYQVEHNSKIYCSDKCCAADNYTKEQYSILYERVEDAK